MSGRRWWRLALLAFGEWVILLSFPSFRSRRSSAVWIHMAWLGGHKSWKNNLTLTLAVLDWATDRPTTTGQAERGDRKRPVRPCEISSLPKVPTRERSSQWRAARSMCGRHHYCIVRNTSLREGMETLEDAVVVSTPVCRC